MARLMWLSIALALFADAVLAAPVTGPSSPLSYAPVQSFEKRQDYDSNDYSLDDTPQPKGIVGGYDDTPQPKGYTGGDYNDRVKRQDYESNNYWQDTTPQPRGVVADSDDTPQPRGVDSDPFDG